MTNTNDPIPSGTIDVTNVVSALQSTFVTFADAAIFAAILAVPGMQWVGLPVLSTLAQWVINWIVSTLAASVVMEAFFMNTAIRKASQASDYIDAVNAKKNLPPTATDQEYYALEQAEVAAFHNFVRFSN